MCAVTFLFPPLFSFSQVLKCWSGDLTSFIPFLNIGSIRLESIFMINFLVVLILQDAYGWGCIGSLR